MKLLLWLVICYYASKWFLKASYVYGTQHNHSTYVWDEGSYEYIPEPYIIKMTREYEK